MVSGNTFLMLVIFYNFQICRYLNYDIVIDVLRRGVNLTIQIKHRKHHVGIPKNVKNEKTLVNLRAFVGSKGKPVQT